MSAIPRKRPRGSDWVHPSRCPRPNRRLTCAASPSSGIGIGIEVRCCRLLSSWCSGFPPAPSHQSSGFHPAGSSPHSAPGHAVSGASSAPPQFQQHSLPGSAGGTWRREAALRVRIAFSGVGPRSSGNHHLQRISGGGFDCHIDAVAECPPVQRPLRKKKWIA
ncbi:hypothetical protein L1887_47353 [Cichorium endivia]|nr:hypothetical protein L1887_47353 [Cichorium endivia]